METWRLYALRFTSRQIICWAINMLQKVTIGTAVFLASLLLASPSLAGSGDSCEEVGSTGIEQSYDNETTEGSFSVGFLPGDTVRVVINTTGLVYAFVDVGSQTVYDDDPLLRNNDTDSGNIILTEEAGDVSWRFVAGDGTIGGKITVYCTPPAPPSSADSMAEMQDTIVQQSSAIATEMITDIVGASIDAAYAGNADAANSFMGYAGTMLVSEPVDGSGSTIWAGLKYHWTLGGDDQWAGGQWTGTGGINFRLDETWVIGVFGGYEQSSIALAALNQTFGGSGGSLGVTAAYRFDDWRIELLGYGSRLSYNIDDAGTAGSFGAWRYVLDGKLTGTLPVAANFDFVPTAGLAIVREQHDAYVDSASAAHGTRDYLAARATAGGKLVFFPTSGGYTVSAGAHADYWTTSGQSNSGLTGRVELGTAIDLTATSSLGLNASLDSIGGRQLGATFEASLKAGF